MPRAEIILALISRFTCLRVRITSMATRDMRTGSIIYARHCPSAARVLGETKTETVAATRKTPVTITSARCVRHNSCTDLDIDPSRNIHARTRIPIIPSRSVVGSGPTEKRMTYNGSSAAIITSACSRLLHAIAPKMPNVRTIPII
jgi:hypothetical protein